MKIYYYVDVNGTVRSTSEREGVHFEVIHKETYKLIWIVNSNTSEVVEEAVAWESLSLLAKALKISSKEILDIYIP